MFDLKKVTKWLETINTYYAAGVLAYAAILFISSNSQLFFWVFIITTPLLTAWSGYLFKSFLERRNERHGFSIVSDSMSYEISPNNRSVLRFATNVKAGDNHLMVYPIGYQWTGSGEEGVPKVTGKHQQLLTLTQKQRGRHTLKPVPYEATAVSTDGDWHYWFIALNPPVHKGDVIEIKYSQEFHDKKGQARPYLYYFVRTPMKRLELNVKFPTSMRPKLVSSSFIKPSEPSRPYPKAGVEYDPHKQWATWVIEKPRKGYCYRIHWQ